MNTGTILAQWVKERKEAFDPSGAVWEEISKRVYYGDYGKRDGGDPTRRVKARSRRFGESQVVSGNFRA